MNETIAKVEVVKFIEEVKWELYTRLKDETQPALKEFSYIDISNAIERNLPDGITDDDLRAYAEERARVSLSRTLQLFEKDMSDKVARIKKD